MSHKKLSLPLVLILFIVFLLILNFSKFGTCDDELFEPKGIRLTVVDDPTEFIVITWYTEAKASDPHVKYSRNEDMDDSKSEDATVKLIDQTYIYSVELDDLKSNRTYFYRIYSESSVKTKVRYFTTAEERDSTNIKFIVVGDSQSNDNATKRIYKKIMDSEMGKEAEFFIHLGDIVESGENQYEFNEYFYIGRDVHRYKQCYFTEGNHENGLVTKMYDNIPLPSNGHESLYYSFSWGPASFLSLNNNDEELWPHRKMTLEWLERELERYDEDKYTVWKFAYFHQPLFNTIESRTDKHELISTWCPLFEEYEVDLVFHGHNHMYERTFPMNHLYEVDDSEDEDFKNPKDPMYITSSGMSSKLYNRTDDEDTFTEPDYVAYYKSIQHFVSIEIDINETEEETTLYYEAYEMEFDRLKQTAQDLELMDSMNITKDLPSKYTKSSYDTEAEDIDSFERRPYYIYFILYFSLLGVHIVIFNRPTLKNYVKFKKNRSSIKTEEEVQDEIKDGDFNQTISRKNLKIFLILIIGLSLVSILLNLLSDELSIAAAILVAHLIMIPIYYKTEGKTRALITLRDFLSLLCIAALVYYVIDLHGLFFYFFYLNLITLSIGIVCTLGSYFLSRNIKISKVSKEESFFLGGLLMLFGTVLFFLSTINLIALF